MNEKEIKEKIDIKKQIEELADFFDKNYGNEIRDMLPTSEEGNNFYLHILIYGKQHITLEYVQPGNYNNIRCKDINLYRVCIWDNYDKDVAKEYIGNDVDDPDKLEADAYQFFRDDFDIKEHIKNSIENQLSEEQIEKLYSVLIESEE